MSAFCSPPPFALPSAPRPCATGSGGAPTSPVASGPTIGTVWDEVETRERVLDHLMLLGLPMEWCLRALQEPEVKKVTVGAAQRWRVCMFCVCGDVGEGKA